jgi:hypothetical protein
MFHPLLRVDVDADAASADVAVVVEAQAVVDGQGRGGGQGGNPRMCNGVKITDLTKRLPGSLWSKLTSEVQQEAREAREAKKRKQATIAQVDTGVEPPADNAGDSFGCGLYQDTVARNTNKKSKAQQE